MKWCEIMNMWCSDMEIMNPQIVGGLIVKHRQITREITDGSPTKMKHILWQNGQILRE